jgi:lysosomal acid lipase/cholesteryl ester hydrolase
MGVHDLPAEIDWILNVTGHKKLYYIGHSMGTTMSYVMASMRPEYNDKVHLMVSLAPVAFMSRLKSPIRLLVPFVKDIKVNTNRQRSHRFPSKLPRFPSHKTRPVPSKGF